MSQFFKINGCHFNLLDQVAKTGHYRTVSSTCVRLRSERLINRLDDMFSLIDKV